MRKILNLDLRAVTLKNLAQREICAIVTPIIPDVPYRGRPTKYSYDKRIGILGHLTKIPFFITNNL